MPEYELMYFPIRGRAQAIRYIFIDNGVSFKDTPVTNWAAEKPKMPFGQLPVLKEDGKMVAQTGAIFRHLGRELGLYSEKMGREELVKVDMIMDAVEDLRKAYSRIIYEDFENEERKSKFINSIPELLKPLNKLMESWNNTYVLQEISVVDYNFFDMLELLQIMSPTCMDDCHALKAYFGRMASREKLKAYRETAEFQNLQINGNKNK